LLNFGLSGTEMASNGSSHNSNLLWREMDKREKISLRDLSLLLSVQFLRICLMKDCMCSPSSVDPRAKEYSLKKSTKWDNIMCRNRSTNSNSFERSFTASDSLKDRKSSSNLMPVRVWAIGGAFAIQDIFLRRSSASDNFLCFCH